MTEQKKRTLQIGFQCPEMLHAQLKRLYKSYPGTKVTLLGEGEKRAAGFVWEAIVPIPAKCDARWHVAHVARLLPLPPFTKFGWHDSFERN